jgi:hypothetical protein
MFVRMILSVVVAAIVRLSTVYSESSFSAMWGWDAIGPRVCLWSFVVGGAAGVALSLLGVWSWRGMLQWDRHVTFG